MKKIPKWIIYFLLIVVFPIACLIGYGMLRNNISLMIDNDLSQKVFINEIIINDKIVFSGERILKEKIRSFENPDNFSFGIFGQVKTITLKGKFDDGSLDLTCKTKESDGYGCFYAMGITINKTLVCACDNPSDFLKNGL